MGADAPPDLFLDMLEQSDLINVTVFNKQLWYVLAALATWISGRATSSDGPELFDLFIFSYGPDEDSPDWNISDAVADAMARLDEKPGTRFRKFIKKGRKRKGNPANMSDPPHPLQHTANDVHDSLANGTPGEGALDKPKEETLTVALHFLGALKRLRTAFPDSVLWVDIARKVGSNSNRCPKLMWLEWSEAVHRATGIDPSQFVAGLTSDADGVPGENVTVPQPSTAHDFEIVVTDISSPASPSTNPLPILAVTETQRGVAGDTAAQNAVGNEAAAVHAHE